MTVEPTTLKDVLLVRPKVFQDARGFFLETYHEAKYASAGITATFVQDNHSKSARGTLRGLHMQVKKPQGKLVRVVRGEIYDVAVDVRIGSPDFGRWIGLNLSAENFHQLYVPEGFAHGFAVLSDVAEVEYKCTDFYDAADEISIRYDEPAFGVSWPVADPLLSARDTQAQRLEDVLAVLPRYANA